MAFAALCLSDAKSDFFARILVFIHHKTTPWKFFINHTSRKNTIKVANNVSVSGLLCHWALISVLTNAVRSKDAGGELNCAEKCLSWGSIEILVYEY
jgi:hypothetical protein